VAWEAIQLRANSINFLTLADAAAGGCLGRAEAIDPALAILQAPLPAAQLPVEQPDSSCTITPAGSVLGERAVVLDLAPVAAVSKFVLVT
jgi:hypothetical protein